jgi:hypothetical protein
MIHGLVLLSTYCLHLFFPVRMSDLAIGTDMQRR